MRVKVGRVVDLTKDVNLSDLSPLDRIIASATNAYQNTNFYRRRVAETQEKLDEQTRKVKEALANNILAIISQQLRDNKLLGEKGDKCVGLLLKVPNRFVPYLSEVISMQEFIPYSINIIPPSKAAQRFMDAPYLLYVESRES